MRTIYQIAKSELRSLFCSPIAWLILVIFVIQVCGGFIWLWDWMVNYKEAGRDLQTMITRSVFLIGGRAPFETVQSTLYLYIPLLTMGLMSREYSSGSIKLLYSSPISSTQIILGKFLSMMIYGVVLMFILVILMFFSLAYVKNLDYPMVLTGILGLYLLMCAYSAIGLFMSTLTSYQIIAALGTLTTLGALNFVGSMGQSIPFVRDITYWFSMKGRVSQFVNGMITSEDVLYFVIVSALFIMISIFVLYFQKRSVSRSRKVGTYTLVVVVTMMAGYVSSRPAMKIFYDATEHKRLTLTPGSQEIVSQLNGGMTITTYVNLMDDFFGYLPSYWNSDFTTFDQYVRFKPEIKTKYVYYYDNVVGGEQRTREQMEEIVRKLTATHDFNPRFILPYGEIDKIIDLAPEGKRTTRLIQRANGQSVFLRYYNDQYRRPFETEISSALKTFIVERPRVGFLSGHGERSIERDGDRNIRSFTNVLSDREALINKGFAPFTLAILPGAGIPAEVNVLVVADPREPMRTDELEAIKAYVDRGGNLIILTEPYRTDITSPLLEYLGVTYVPGVLVSPNPKYQPDLIFAEYTDEATELIRNYKRLKEIGRMTSFPGAVALDYSGVRDFDVTEIAVSPATGSWNELQTRNFLLETPECDPSTGEMQKAMPIAIALTREADDRRQRIAVVGDADCVSNGELSANRDLYTANYSFINSLFQWMVYDEFPVDVSRPAATDDDIYLTPTVYEIYKPLFQWVLPALMVLCYLIIWFRRRK